MSDNIHPGVIPGYVVIPHRQVALFGVSMILQKQTMQTGSLIRNILAISQAGHFFYKQLMNELIAFM